MDLQMPELLQAAHREHLSLQVQAAGDVGVPEGKLSDVAYSPSAGSRSPTIEPPPGLGGSEEEDTSDEGPCAEDEASDSGDAPGPGAEAALAPGYLDSGQEARQEAGAPPARQARTLELRRGGGAWPEAAPAEAEAWRGSGGLPAFDAQRYLFWRVLADAPRSGGKIELHVDLMTGATVAVKRVPQHRMLGSAEAYRQENPNEFEDPWQELLVTQRLGCPGPHQVLGVCPCHGAFISPEGDTLLVSDYIPGGDLFDIANNLGLPGPSREQKAWPIVCSLLEAVLMLHAHGVAHGDVSLENALRQCHFNSQVALVDFGMAVTGDITKAIGIRGKPSYQAPEMHVHEIYDARCTDLFAVGVAAYGLAFGGYPWSSTKPNTCVAFAYAWRHGLQAFLQRRQVTVDGTKMSVAACLSARYLKLLTVLLDFEPCRRLAVVSYNWRTLA